MPSSALSDTFRRASWRIIVRVLWYITWLKKSTEEKPFWFKRSSVEQAKIYNSLRKDFTLRNTNRLWTQQRKSLACFWLGTTKTLITMNEAWSTHDLQRELWLFALLSTLLHHPLKNSLRRSRRVLASSARLSGCTQSWVDLKVFYGHTGFGWRFGVSK